MATNKRYASVSELVRDVSEETSFADEFEKKVSERQILKQLFSMRSSKGMSQEDVAEKMDCTQSRVSKIENGKDEDLRLRDLNAYADALGFDIRLTFTERGVRAVDEIKFYAFSIKRTLARLVELAHKDPALAKAISQFHGEAFINLVMILQESAQQIPMEKGQEGFHIDFVPTMVTGDCPGADDVLDLSESSSETALQ